MRKIDGGKKETTIDHEWIGPGATARVKILPTGDGNSGAHFELEIEGGQVEFKDGATSGMLSIDGDWERGCFIELLEQIVIELKLIDQK